MRLPLFLGATLLLAAAARPPVPTLAAAAAAASSPEFDFVDEEDDARAEALLGKLLKKYDTPRECEALAKLLRTRRAYPASPKERETLEFACPDGKTRQFTILLPPKYSPRRPTGVLFWLHGAVRQPPPGGGANEAAMFQPAVKDMGLIVVGPSTYQGVEWGSTACRALVRHALAVVKRRCNVDENRVWIAGDSDGGRGTFAMVETEATFFAAAVPTIGSPGGVTRFLNLRNLPWLAVNGGKDSIFKLDHVREMVEGMKASGIDLEWKLLPDAGHDPRLFLKHRDEVQAFLRDHPRDPLPARVDWCLDPEQGDPGFPANTFRWIRIEEAGSSENGSSFEDDGKGLLRADLPRVSATREGNRIQVRTRGVKRVTVLLSDGMVDLDEPVEVVVNGRVLHRGKVAPDARAILEEARLFRDRELVFRARLALEVDGPEAGRE